MKLYRLFDIVESFDWGVCNLENLNKILDIICSDKYHPYKRYREEFEITEIEIEDE